MFFLSGRGSLTLNITPPARARRRKKETCRRRVKPRRRLKEGTGRDNCKCTMTKWRDLTSRPAALHLLNNRSVLGKTFSATRRGISPTEDVSAAEIPFEDNTCRALIQRHASDDKRTRPPPLLLMRHSAPASASRYLLISETDPGAQHHGGVGWGGGVMPC